MNEWALRFSHSSPRPVASLLYNDRSLARRHPAEASAHGRGFLLFPATQASAGARRSRGYPPPEVDSPPETTRPVDSPPRPRRAGQETQCHNLYVSPRLLPQAAATRVRHRLQGHAPPRAVPKTLDSSRSVEPPEHDFR